MSILVKGTDFGPTEQVTSTKLDNLVDAAKFTNTSETAVAYTGSTGTCLQGGGLEVTTAGQLQIQDGEVDLVKFSTALRDSIHPVGIILETIVESTAAAFQTKIGFGTWEAYGSGQVTVGYNSGDNDFDAIGSGTNTNSTTGSKTHTLTTTEIPPHYHTYTEAYERASYDNGSIAFTLSRTSNTGNGNIGENGDGTGNAAPHNNLQPYTVVYRYRRTA